MDKEEILKKVEKLLSLGRVEEALEELLKLANEQEWRDIVVDLQGQKFQLSQISRQEIRGIMTFEQSMREKNRIFQSILEILNKVRYNLEMEEEDNDQPIPDPVQKKTILFLASNPIHKARLALEREFIKIQNSLAEFEHQYQCEPYWDVTSNSLQAGVLKHRPDIIHFSGHGYEASDKNGQEGGLYVKNSYDLITRWEGRDLADLFKILKRKVPVSIVLLNACFSLPQAEGIVEHVDYVLGLDDKVEDEVAIAFSEAFYRALAREDDVEFAFELANQHVKMNGLSRDVLPQLLKRS